MPIRISQSVEKNVVSVPFPPKVIPTNTATDILNNELAQRGELSARLIQNVGANECYFAFGHDCDPTNFNGILAKPAALDANGFGAGQQLDISNCGQRVSLYSVGGTTIAITLLKRNDNAQGQGNILQG